MANKKISALTAATTPDGTELVPIVQGGTTKKATVSQLTGATVPLGQSALARTAVKTANYNAVVGDLIPCDTSGGAFTVTLPTAPVNKAMIAVKLVTAGSVLTIASGGSDVFNKTGGSTTLALWGAFQAVVLEYNAAGAIWTVTADDLPLTMTYGARWTTGLYYRPPGLRSGNLTTTLNRLYFVPLWVPPTAAIDRLSIASVGTGVASSVARMGIYGDTGGGKPGTLLYELATPITTTGTGALEGTVSPSQSLVAVAPLCWIAFVSQGGASGISTTAQDSTSGDHVPMGGTLADMVTAMLGYYDDSVSGALPGTAVAANRLTLPHPIIAVRAA